MNTYTYIIIYLSICALMIIFISAVRRQWGEFFIIIPQYYRDMRKINHTTLKVWMARMLLSIVFIVTIPIFFVLTPFLVPFLIEKERRNRKIIKEKNKEEKLRDNNLYFKNMGGVGNIECLDCNYQEKIVSFIHGNYNAISGFQCQSCGRFHSVRSHLEEYHMIGKYIDPLICNCGGILESV